jgi:hypothetical protein
MPARKRAGEARDYEKSYPYTNMSHVAAAALTTVQFRYRKLDAPEEAPIVDVSDTVVGTGVYDA